MAEKILFNPFNACSHFLFNGITDTPGSILDIYRSFAKAWHDAGVELRGKPKGGLSFKLYEAQRDTLHVKLLELKVGIQLLVDAGILGSSSGATPYKATLQIILKTWLDNRRKTHDELMGQADDSFRRSLKRAGVVNLIHREGCPALMVINGEAALI